MRRFSFFRLALVFVLTACITVLFAHLTTAPASASPQAQWVSLITGTNADETPVVTKVFGYYANVKGFGQIFIVCDPNTGEETDVAYVPGAVVGNKQVQKLVGYDRKKKILFDQVKTIQPPSVSIIAPNIPASYGNWDWDWFRQTGQIVHKMSGAIAWPGSYSWQYLVPDSSCWLIVAQITNPNPFPIKAGVQGWVGEWRDSDLDRLWNVSNPHLSYKEIPLNPGETKYFLMWSGPPPNGAMWLLSDWEDGYYWVDCWYNGTIVENNDPELPEACRPNVGFYPVTLVGWSSISTLLPMNYRFTIQAVKYSPQGRWEWSASGEMWWKNDGTWKFEPSKNSSSNSSIATILEDIFNRRAFASIPWTLWSDDYVNTNIDGVYFSKIYDCSGYWQAIKGGPMAGADGPGPVLTKDWRRALKDDPPTFKLQAPLGSSVGWSKKIPVLQQDLVFIDRYTFIPTGSDGSGVLSKQTVPGYLLKVEFIDRPYFYEHSVLLNCKLEKAYYDWFKRCWFTRTWEYTPGTGWVYCGIQPKVDSWVNTTEKHSRERSWWRCSITAAISINLVNPSNVTVTFSRTKKNYPGLPNWADKIAFYPTSKFLLTRPDFPDNWQGGWQQVNADFVITDKNTITAEKKTTVPVLSQQPVTITGVIVLSKGGDEKTMQNWIESNLFPIINSDREACLYLGTTSWVSSYNFSIQPTEKYPNEYIISLASAEGVYSYKKEGRWRYNYYNVGFVSIFNSMYFNDDNPTKGFAAIPTDEVYKEIMQNIRTTASFTYTSRPYDYGGPYDCISSLFWPVYDWGKAYDKDYSNVVTPNY